MCIKNRFATNVNHGHAVIDHASLASRFALCETAQREHEEKGTGTPTGRAYGSKPVSLKELAEHLGLSPATVSLVINRSPVADSIPQQTKDRVFAAARKYKYRPNFFARSLRAQYSFTIGVIVPEVSDGYSASVMSGIEDFLLQEGYFYFVVSHRHRADLIDEYPRLFLERSVDGLIAVDTPWTLSLSVPVVTVSGHNQVKGVTNIVLEPRTGRRSRAQASRPTGPSPHRFHQGAGVQFRHGGALGQYSESRTAVSNSDCSELWCRNSKEIRLSGTGI